MNGEKAIGSLQKLVNGSLSHEEHVVLMDWIQNSDSKQVEFVMEQYADIVLKLEKHSADPLLFQQIKETIARKAKDELEIIQMIPEESNNKEYKVKKLFTWYRAVAAAVLILMFGAGAYWLKQSRLEKQVASIEKNILKNDIAPGKEGAILTLDNGTQIVLDSVQNGSVAQQGNGLIVKEDGQLSIRQNGNISSGQVYNTMSTPNGRQFKLVLADGTTVWLNAASSIYFPTSFPGEERTVTVTGEVYFEVAHNARQPFIVKVKGEEIRVLGTHFNVNAYSNEEAIKTTLLEGSVKVQDSNGQSLMIKPGQQAIGTGNGHLTVNDAVDIDGVMAWKNGLFNFNNADIKEIMKQAARWYDVEVVYEGDISNGRYIGKVARNTNLGEMMKILELNGVKYRIEGRKIIIMASP